MSQKEIKGSKLQNLTRSEKSAVKELKSIKSIIIKPADKGSASVVMNSDDYKSEVNRQLSDPKFYLETKTDLTTKHSAEVNEIVKNMFEIGEISGQTRDYLISDSARTARFYTLPKVHKNKIPPPGRPIVSGNGCPTEKISEFVDFFLNPLSKEFPSYVKDTNHFLQKINKIKKVPKGAFLFSLDVEALYID